MTNLFSEIEEQVIFNEEIMFDESKIKEFILNYITNKLIIKLEKERPFYFEQIIEPDSTSDFGFINTTLLSSSETAAKSIPWLSIPFIFLGSRLHITITCLPFSSSFS